MLKPIFAFEAGSSLSFSDQWKAHFRNRPRPGPKANVSFRAAASTDSPAEIFIYDEIGWYGITASEFQRNLLSISASAIDVHINSPGGDVFDGIAIYNALRSHPAEITCYVDGIAASAASFIALAGKKCIMAETAMMMIHKAWGMTIGNADDHLEQAIVLGKIDDTLAAIYASKTGKKPEECLAIMAAETWLSAQEAMDNKLCDGMVNELANKAARVAAQNSTVLEEIIVAAPTVTDEEPDSETLAAEEQAEIAAAEAMAAAMAARSAGLRRRLALAAHAV